jgi:hypothetical protein
MAHQRTTGEVEEQASDGMGGWGANAKWWRSMLPLFIVWSSPRKPVYM